MIIHKGYLCRRARGSENTVIQNEYIVLQSKTGPGVVVCTNIVLPKEMIGKKIKLRCEIEEVV